MRSTKCGGNHFDEETHEKYYISEAKKDGRDRHEMGGDIIMIDSNVLDDYLAFRGWNKLDPNNYKVVTIDDMDTSRFDEIEKES